jgi:hypothetical protein
MREQPLIGMAFTREMTFRGLRPGTSTSVDGHPEMNFRPWPVYQKTVTFHVRNERKNA